MPTTEHKPHPDAEDSIDQAYEALLAFRRRTLAAAIEMEDGCWLDALAHSCDAMLENMNALLGELEVDADGMATERVNEQQYAEW